MCSLGWKRIHMHAVDCFLSTIRMNTLIWQNELVKAPAGWKTPLCRHSLDMCVIQIAPSAFGLEWVRLQGYENNKIIIFSLHYSFQTGHDKNQRPEHY